MKPNQIQDYRGKIERTIRHLQKKSKILFLTTSNRWVGEAGGEMPKSTALAHHLAEQIGSQKVTIVDIPKLNIVPCEGNVSTERGNTCGLKKAALKDSEKNPSGQHRCWASMNHKEDELWKISKPLLESDAVIFFASVRWGQLNSYYQKLIERLTWLENRHSTLGEENIIKNIEAGLIVVGQNWNGSAALETQKKVLEFYGFRIVEELFWNWQFTQNTEEENDSSYKEAALEFKSTFNII